MDQPKLTFLTSLKSPSVPPLPTEEVKHRYPIACKQTKEVSLSG